MVQDSSIEQRIAERVKLPPGFLEEFCKRHHIRRLSLFGSVLRDDFRPESDIDLLVEFDPEHIPGFIGLGRMEMEVSGLVGRPIDMRTINDFAGLSREKVLQEAILKYDS